MRLALYRKYRPKSLSDVVGQDHIVASLKNALKTGKISHAYLFTGPKGVGKTSIARILAHELNGLEYSDDSMHLDIIEIDAASNRRIDEIRDLRDKVHIAPTSAKYKVYIIDEVHMLTREAFNALLKTLEEPPAHAIFILATTEAHKVPDTIISRTQRFTFKPIDNADTVAHLADLAKQEKINITPDALELLATHGGGSFRDSINLLDQMVGGDEQITSNAVQTMLGMPGPEIVVDLLDALSGGDIATIAGGLVKARIGGVHGATLARELARSLRAGIISGQTEATEKTITLLSDLALVPASSDPYTSLELALFNYSAVPNRQSVAATPTATKAEAQPEVPAEAPTVVVTAPPSATLVDEASYWQALLAHTKKSHNTLYSFLRMAEPQLDGDKLTLVFAFAFHQKQMSQAANQKRVSDAITELLGRPIEVHCVTAKVPPITTKRVAATSTAPVAPTKAPAQEVASETLSSVTSIFDGAELLE